MSRRLAPSNRRRRRIVIGVVDWFRASTLFLGSRRDHHSCRSHWILPGRTALRSIDAEC